MFTRTAPRNITLETLFEQVNKPRPHRDTITVAVSLFNYEMFIGGCLNSIFKQRHEHIDLIVVDDRSTTDAGVQVTEVWMRENHSRFGRVSLLRHRDNQGLAEARNTAFLHSRVDPVFVIDADNEIYPRALGRLHEFIQYRFFDAAYTQLEFFGDVKGVGYADFWNRARFRTANYVDAMALISRRSWEQVGGYSHMEGGWEDYDLWCKFIERGMKAAFVPEILCRYRVHGSSMLRTETNVANERLRVEMTMRHPWLSIS